MKSLTLRRLTANAAFGLIATLLAVAAAVAQPAPIVVDFDSNGEFPGDPLSASLGGAFTFFGGGLPPDYADDDPPTVVEGISTTGVGGTQGYEINWDSTIDAGGYAYYGLGGFLRFHNNGDPGWADGQVGQNYTPGYEVSFDLKLAGAIVQQPIRGNITLFKGDYEAVYGVDANNDGDMDDGYDIWSAEYAVPVVADDYADFNQVVLNLAQIGTPTAPAPEITTPVFDDASSFMFNMYFNNDEFGTDAGNIITLDNLALSFTSIDPPDADFDNDGDVDGNDFLVWQRGGSPNGVTPGDLAAWQTNYGGPTPNVALATSVPEPASLALLFGALLCVGVRRSGR